MKKVAFALVAVMLFAGSSAALAQTPASTSSLQALIETLKSQIAALQAKVEAERRATSEVREAAGDVKETLGLIRELREGMSGEDVKLLQSVLAADFDIYPEGRVTGFFGPLTAQAVKRFQAKHGVSQVGRVGPQTLGKLKAELTKNPIGEENVPQDGKRLCAIVPPGHLIAPGWLRKNQAPIVPACQKLPPGIAAKLGVGTSTPPTSTDIVAPLISGVLATAITPTSTIIVWNTNEKSDSAVWYSTSSGVQATGTAAVASSALTKEHSLALANVSPATPYYFVVASADEAGNKAVSTQYSFSTLSAPDVAAPVISGVTTTNITASSAHVIWNTNELATSKVWYSTATPVVANGTTTPSVSTPALATSHDRTLPDLIASTTYYFVVESADPSGNKAQGAQASFSTLAE